MCNIFRCQTNDGRVILENGKVFHKNQLLPGFGEWIHSILEFGVQLHSQMTLDISSVSCMAALALVTREYLLTRNQYFAAKVCDSDIFSLQSSPKDISNTITV